jgi:hypothetical protein
MEKKITSEILSRHWVHSHEEDTETEMVFRPASFNFPRSRGRRAFELKPDGSLVDIGIGPTDRPQEAQGRWNLADDDRLVFHGKTPLGPSRTLQIVSAEKDRLVIRK